MTLFSDACQKNFRQGAAKLFTILNMLHRFQSFSADNEPEGSLKSHTVIN